MSHEMKDAELRLMISELVDESDAFAGTTIKSGVILNLFIIQRDASWLMLRAL